MTSYPYTELDIASRQIRVLVLEPGPFESPISCHIHHKSLNSGTWYEALSYTWGEAGTTRPIIIDNVVCDITVNLEVALRHIRQEDSPRTLWVDALCINQKDMEERSAQVQIMHDLYEAAGRILAWTGPSSYNSDEAIEIMVELGTLMQNSLDDIGNVDKIGPDAMRKMGFDPASKNWPALWDFWKRSYWNRVWIIQELASCYSFPPLRNSNKDKGLVGCGSRWVSMNLYIASALYFNLFIMSFGHLYLTFQHGQPTYGEPYGSYVHNMPLPAIDMAHALRFIHNDVFENSGEESSLRELIARTRSFQASDVRDKIYALLGISSERKLFRADYTRADDRAFMDLVEFYVENWTLTPATSQLEILYCNRHCRERFGPSWIPEPYGLVSNSPNWEPEFTPFSAGGHEGKFPAKFDMMQGNMSVMGVKIGIIRSKIGPFQVSREPAFTSEMKSVYNDLRNFYLSCSEDQRETFLRCLVTDQNSADISNVISPAPAELGRIVPVALGFERVPDSFGSIEQSPEARLLEYIRPYQRSLDFSMTERSFFTTYDGRMGVGPYTTTSDDLVVMLFGGVFCFVLRPKGNEYELIGDAYVHGVMHGELLRDHADGNVTAELFTLC